MMWLGGVTRPCGLHVVFYICPCHAKPYFRPKHIQTCANANQHLQWKLKSGVGTYCNDTVFISLFTPGVVAKGNSQLQFGQTFETLPNNLYNKTTQFKPYSAYLGRHPKKRQWHTQRNRESRRRRRGRQKCKRRHMEVDTCGVKDKEEPLGHKKKYEEPHV